jgi:DNA-binding beta-propeller fold protein YncE
MQTKRGRLQVIPGALSVALLCLASISCSQASGDDRFYGTAGIPGDMADGQLLSIDVRGQNDVTITPVGRAGSPGCASVARSSQGTLYTVCGIGIAKPGPQQLATIDPTTGRATMVGPVVDGLQVMGLEFAPNGTLYAVGDANPASPTFNSLYTVDEKTGVFTRVGSTGVPAPEFFMDFAFDARGTMYGATSHTLFTIDPTTATATKVVDFVGGGDIMGLSYNTAEDKLYATDWKAPNSALYLVDTRTGFLTPMASIGHPLAHGLVTSTP